MLKFRVDRRIIQEYFLSGFCDYMGKADLSKGYWNPKKKIGGNSCIFQR